MATIPGNVPREAATGPVRAGTGAAPIDRTGPSGRRELRATPRNGAATTARCGRVARRDPVPGIRSSGRRAALAAPARAATSPACARSRAARSAATRSAPAASPARRSRRAPAPRQAAHASSTSSGPAARRARVRARRRRRDSRPERRRVDRRRVHPRQVPKAAPAPTVRSSRPTCRRASRTPAARRTRLPQNPERSPRCPTRPAHTPARRAPTAAHPARPPSPARGSATRHGVRRHGDRGTRFSQRSESTAPAARRNRGSRGQGGLHGQ